MLFCRAVRRPQLEECRLAGPGLSADVIGGALVLLKDANGGGEA